MTGWGRWALAVAALVLGAGLAAAEGPAPGTRFEQRPGDLASPGDTPSVANPPEVVRRPPGVVPTVPPGFKATLFADGLSHARWLAAADDGDVFLAESNAGRITLLRDSTGKGVADLRTTFAEGFRMPHGLAVRPEGLYVADLEGVWLLTYQAGDTKARDRRPVTVPGALGDAGGHWTRNLVFARDGRHFWVSVGSRGNLGVEPDPRATIQAFALEDGTASHQHTFAAGLRNPVGIALRPDTDELWTVVNERDGMGDGLVPDYLTHVEEGAFYGWPYAYLGPHPQPGFTGKRADLAAKTVMPDLLFKAHSAPLGLVFYDGTQFPREMRGDAFVALHGSWNSSEPTGYAVVRIPFKNGKPAGGYEVFAGGFWIAGDSRAQVWGRPVGLAVTRDGSLLIADDVGQTVWRISYQR